MVDGFVGGYLNFLCVFMFLLFVNIKAALISLLGVGVSFIFLVMISKHSLKNTKVLNAENEKLTRAALEYTRGLPIVKSFGMEGVSIKAFKEACASGKKIA